MPAGDRSTPQKAAFLNCEERQLMRYAPFPSCNTTLTTFFAREFRLLTSTVGTSLFMQSSMLSFLSKPDNGAEENHEGRCITIHYLSSSFSLSGIERLPAKEQDCLCFLSEFTSGTYCMQSMQSYYTHTTLPIHEHSFVPRQTYTKN